MWVWGFESAVTGILGLGPVAALVHHGMCLTRTFIKQTVAGKQRRRYWEVRAPISLSRTYLQWTNFFPLGPSRFRYFPGWGGPRPLKHGPLGNIIGSKWSGFFTHCQNVKSSLKIPQLVYIPLLVCTTHTLKTYDTGLSFLYVFSLLRDPTKLAKYSSLFLLTATLFIWST